MVEVKRIKAPSDIPAEGSYVLVLYGPSAMDREHPRGRTLVVRDGKRDKVKLDEFAAAIETAKTLAETKHFQTVYVSPTSRELSGNQSRGERCSAQRRLRLADVPVSRTECYGAFRDRHLSLITLAT